MAYHVNCKNYDEAKVALLQRELNVSRDFALLLYSRGMTEASEAKDFLFCDRSMLADPFLLPNMQKAAESVKKAIALKKRILLFGDYDCDGISAVSILYLYLKSQNVDVLTFIPDRFRNGYGMTASAIDEILALSPDMVITVDCGSSSKAEVEYLTTKGVEVIVTDHHEIQDDCLPDCVIVDAKLSERTPLYDLCGAGVAFKLVEAIAGREEALNYVDIAGLATVADIVPLTGENRIITKLGLARLNAGSRTGITLLAKNLSISRITAYDIGFRIAPRINSIGRLSNCNRVLPLFISNEYFELQCLIDELNTMNEQRKEIDKAITRDAERMIEALDIDIEKTPIFILASSDWDVGVLGISAQRISEKYCRPTLLLTEKDGVLRGSGRSIDSIDIFECLSSMKELFISFGGHSKAVGVTVSLENLDAFRESASQYLLQHYKTLDFLPKVECEITIDKAFTYKDCVELEMLEPCGLCNQRPKLLLSSLSCKPFARISNTIFAKSKLNADCDVICFDEDICRDLLLSSSLGLEARLVTSASLKSFRNHDYVQIIVLDEELQCTDTLSDDNELLSLYIKQMLYNSEEVPRTSISFSDAVSMYERYPSATAFIAFDTATALSFIEKCREQYQRTPTVVLQNASPALLSSLFIHPQSNKKLLGYKRLVFLDEPLSHGYVKYLSANDASKSIFVVNDGYGIQKKLQKAVLKKQSVDELFLLLRSLYLKTNIPFTFDEIFSEASRAMECSRLELNLAFYVLYELKALVYDGKAYSPCELCDIRQSLIYQKFGRE